MQYEIPETPETLNKTLSEVIRSDSFNEFTASTRVALRSVLVGSQEHRPVNASGEHTAELHTPTCGCKDKGPCRYEERKVNDFGDDMRICRNHEQPSKYPVDDYPHYPCLAVDGYDEPNGEDVKNESTDEKLHLYYHYQNRTQERPVCEMSGFFMDGGVLLQDPKGSPTCAGCVLKAENLSGIIPVRSYDPVKGYGLKETRNTFE